MTRATLHTDGAAEPTNPGPAALGYVLRADGEPLAAIGATIGHATCNQAEYRALIAGLERALELGVTELDVRADSMLVIQQMTGRWRVKNEGLREVWEDAQRLAARFEHVDFRHIPREQNEEADALAQAAFEAEYAYACDLETAELVRAEAGGSRRS